MNVIEILLTNFIFFATIGLIAATMTIVLIVYIKFCSEYVSDNGFFVVGSAMVLIILAITIFTTILMILFGVE